MRSNPVKQIFSSPANNTESSPLSISDLQQNGVLPVKTSLTLKSKLQFSDEAKSLAGFSWPFCRFSASPPPPNLRVADPPLPLFVCLTVSFRWLPEHRRARSLSSFHSPLWWSRCVRTRYSHRSEGKEMWLRKWGAQKNRCSHLSAFLSSPSIRSTIISHLSRVSSSC